MKKILRFGLLILGAVFFANPNVNIIDILPDAVGALCIYVAIFKLGDLYGEIAEAKRAFLTLFWVTASKLPAILIMLWVTGTNANESTIRLVFAFSYAVMETVFGIRAFRLLFDGLGYIGSRRDGGECLYYRVLRPARQVKLRNGKLREVPARVWRLESLAGCTYVFLIVKAVLYALPEVTTLATQNSLGEITPEGRALADFYPLLLGISVFVGLIFGAIWLYRFCAYVCRLVREREFFRALHEQYTATVLPRRGVFVMRRVHVFALFVSAAALFSADLYLDTVNRLPDFVSAILFFVAACVIAKEIGGAKWLKITSIAYFVTSLVTYVFMLRFTKDYVYSAVHKIGRAQELYLPYAVANAVTQVAFIAVVFALASVVMRTVRQHTGLDTVTDTSSAKKSLALIYKGRTVRMCIFGVLAAIMSSLYFYFVVDIKPVSLREGAYGGGGYVYFPRFETAWIVDLLLILIFAIFTCNLVNDLVNEVRYKYQYE